VLTQNYINPKWPDTDHTHESLDGDFDAVWTVVLCKDYVINYNDKASRSEVAKTSIFTVHQCSGRRFTETEKTVDFGSNSVYIITGISYWIRIKFATVRIALLRMWHSRTYNYYTTNCTNYTLGTRLPQLKNYKFLRNLVLKLNPLAKMIIVKALVLTPYCSDYLCYL